MNGILGELAGAGCACQGTGKFQTGMQGLAYLSKHGWIRAWI